MQTQDSVALNPNPIPAAMSANFVEIETRFGRVAFNTEHVIEMTHGLPGFPGRRTFGLSPLPSPRFDHFLLFQDLEDSALCFLVMPMSPDAGLIDQEDIVEALATTGIERVDASFLLIVTLRKDPEGLVTTVNLRAPIVLDTENKVARQYVMPNGKYAIRHVV